MFSRGRKVTNLTSEENHQSLLSIRVDTDEIGKAGAQMIWQYIIFLVIRSRKICFDEFLMAYFTPTAYQINKWFLEFGTSNIKTAAA